MRATRTTCGTRSPAGCRTRRRTETNARECGGKAELWVSLSSLSPVPTFAFLPSPLAARRPRLAPPPASTRHNATTTTQRRLRRAPPIGRCGVMVHDVIIAELRMRTAACPRGTRSQRPGLERETDARERGGDEEEKKMTITRARTRAPCPLFGNERSTLHSEKMLLTNCSSVLLNTDRILQIYRRIKN